MRASDWALWLGSLAVVAVSNFLGGNVDPLTLIAALTGVTALMLAAKGQVFAQYLMIVFCLLYGAISCRFRYWGEMLTYLGMSLPMAVWSAVTWRRNTAHEAGSAVAIRRLTGRDLHVEDGAGHRAGNGLTGAGSGGSGLGGSGSRGSSGSRGRSGSGDGSGSAGHGGGSGAGDGGGGHAAAGDGLDGNFVGGAVNGDSVLLSHDVFSPKIIKFC